MTSTKIIFISTDSIMTGHVRTEEFVYSPDPGPNDYPKTATFTSAGVILVFSNQTQYFVPWHRIVGIENYTSNGVHPLSDRIK